MELTHGAERLRIYTGESDKHEGRLLHEIILEEARRRGLAGATVLRGLAGYGANSRVHTATILRLSEDLPLIVEIVDVPEHIEAFLPFLDTVMKEGLVTREAVDVLFYRHNQGRKG